MSSKLPAGSCSRWSRYLDSLLETVRVRQSRSLARQPTRSRRRFTAELLEDRTLLTSSLSAANVTELISWRGHEVTVFQDEWIAVFDSEQGAGSNAANPTVSSVEHLDSLFRNSGNRQSAPQTGRGGVRGTSNAGSSNAGLANPVATASRKLGRENNFLIRSAGDVGATAIEAALNKMPGFRYVEPNFVVSIDQTPNDPLLSYLWGQNTSSDNDIDAPEAWDLTTGSSSVVVGVIDTGVDYLHEDLAANMWVNPGECVSGVGTCVADGIDNDGNGYVDDFYGWDFVNEDNDPMDDHSHGTHVAGTIAAVGNNSTGVVGVSWSSEIMALKFLDASGNGSTSDAIEAVDYATMMKQLHNVNIQLTNNSWGGGGFSQALYDAISASKDQDMLFIAAAGNDGTDNDTTPHYPSSYDLDNIVAVASTDLYGNRSSFSNYGLTSVDLGAPGSSIYSTLPGDGYGYKSGTSMATPQVSGIAALAWTVDPNATYLDMRNAILNGAESLSSMQGVTVTGSLANAYETLEQLGLLVTATTPNRDAIVTTPPTSFTVDFSDALDATTVQSTDLAVNGVAADSVTIVDADTLEFTYTVSPVSSNGEQTITMPADSVLRLSDAHGLAGLSAVFYYDQTPLTVVASTPANGGILTLPNPTIRLDFSEPFAPGSIHASDLIVSEGRVVSATIIDADTVDYELTDIVSESPLIIDLPVDGVRDLIGLPGQSFTATLNPDFSVDVWPEALSADDPLGSLVYSSTLTGGLHTNSDVDSFLLSLEAGQSLSVALLPAAGLGGRIRILDPSNTELASVTGTAGNDVLVQAVPIATGGEYTVVVESNGSTSGAYEVELHFNSLLEDEAYGGPTNNVKSKAESIDASWTSLDPITSRQGVTGAFDGTADSDWYEVTLAAATPSSFLMSSSAVGASFSLHQSNGQLITDSTLASNGDRVIQAYVPGSTGTYLLKLEGDNAAYHLAATFNTTISVETNDDFANAQNIDSTGRALGHVGSDSTSSTSGTMSTGLQEAQTLLGGHLAVSSAWLEGAASITQSDGIVEVAWDGVFNPAILEGAQQVTENFVSIDTAPEGDGPRDAVFTPDGQRFVMANRDSRNILVYNAATGAIEADIPINGRPETLAITPNGQYVLSANPSANSVSVISLSTLTQVAEIPTARAWPYLVKVTPNGQEAIVATADNYFLRINLTTFTQVGEFAAQDLGAHAFASSVGRAHRYHTYYREFAITPDGTTIVSGGGKTTSGAVHLYDIAMGTETSLTTSRGLYSVSISADGTKAYLGSRNGSPGDLVVEVDIPNKTILRTLNTERLTGEESMLTPDEQYLLVPGSNKLLFIDLTDGSTSSTINENATDFGLSYDGKYVLVGNTYGRVVDVQTQAVVASLPMSFTDFVAISPVDYRAIQWGLHFDETIAVININGASSAQEYVIAPGSLPEGDRPFDVALSSDGLTAVTVNYFSDNISIIDVMSGLVTGYVDTGRNPDDVAITPDGAYAVVTSPVDESLAIIDLDTQTVAKTLTGFANGPRHVLISADGQTAYVNTTDDNGPTDKVYFVNLDGAQSSVTGSLTVGNIANFSVQYSQMSLSPDGSLLAVPASRDDEVVLISTATNTEVARLSTGAMPMELEFSPDGTRLYSLNEYSHSVTVINVDGASSAVVTEVPLTGFVFSMVIDETGDFLYVGSWANAGVEVVDLATNSVIKNVPTSGFQPRDMVISDGVIYLAGSYGTTLVLPLEEKRGVLTRVLADGPDTLLIDETDLSGSPSAVVFSAPLMTAIPVINSADGLDLISYVSEGTGDEDFYEFNLPAGDQVSLSTALPGVDPGLFDNTLNVAVELYDSADQLLERGLDGSLSYVVPSAGTYKARVYAQGFTSGEYLFAMATTPTVALSVDTATIDESGGTATVTATLSSLSASDVTIDIAATGTALGTGVDYSAPTQITITAGQLQGSVTVAIVEDSVAELAETIVIDVTAVTNAVEEPAQQVTITIADNDPAGFSVTESGGSTSVSETGTTDSFDIVLTAAPQSDVVLTVVTDRPAEANIDTASLTFTPANWNVAQTVTVTGVDDPTVDGEQISTVTIAVNDALSDDLFDLLADSAVTVTTTDDDVAGFSVTPTAGSTVVSEAGSTDTFDVVLTAAPLTDVVLTVVADDSSEASVNAANLTFTPANWNVGQSVTVTGIDDFIIDGDQLSSITVGVDAPVSDDAFDLLADLTLSVSNTDDDVAGFVIAETQGTTIVSEQGTSDTFTVVLTAEPFSDVVITVTSGDPDEVTTDVSQLTFTSANWNLTQTVTVTGVDDLIADGSQTTLVTLSIDDITSDDNFDALADQAVSVSTEDNDDGILRGVKFEDLDADGFRDADERGLPGVTIYVDANDNGVLDSGELSTVTDANGAYEFTDMLVGTHVIREIAPADHSQTAPGQVAAFFYGVDADADELVRVDAATGLVSRIGPHGVRNAANGVVYNLSGMVYTSTGRIFGTHNTGTDSFYSIDPQTGSATLVGPTGMEIAGGMAYDVVTNTIYGLGQVNSVWTLVTFNPNSGAATAIGPGSIDVNSPTSLAFDAANNRVIVFDNTDDQFIAFQTDGTASIAGTSTAAIDFRGLTYAGSTLVSSQHIDGTELRTVDSVTGAVSNFVTLSEPVIFGALEYVESVNHAHVISVYHGGILDGLNFGNDPLRAEIRGTKFEDVNANGQWDSGEPALPGVTIYLDQNNNGRFDNGGVLEPDDFAAGTVIGNSLPSAVVTATAGAEFSVVASSIGVAASTASTGTHVFANPVNGAAMSSTEYQLRIDVLDIVKSISIDFTAINGSARGRLRIFDATDSLLDTYSTVALANGESATMQLFGTRIAYAIADTTNSLTGTLDNLKINGGVEPQTITDANGEYSFANLAPGEYSVREVAPDGFRQTSPVVAGQQRLFAVDPRTTATQIIEIDPTTGATLNSFNAPGTSGSPSGFVSGLAFDGVTLFFIDASGDTLFELDPTTGAILDSIPRSTTGRWDGLAVMGGLVYLNDSFSDVIEVIDPATNTLVHTITLNSQSNLNPFGALGELPDASGGQLIGAIGNSSGITLLDPVTGAVNSTFFPGLIGGSQFGLTSLNGEIYIGNNNSAGTVRVFSPTGTFIRSFDAGFDVSALGGGGVISGSHNVTLIANQLVTDLDFGNERLLGDVGGRKFEDANGNGQQDSGEGGMTGVTIYLDANDNGALDSGEFSTTTDSNGDYLFSDIPIGDYIIREVHSSGFVQTTPGLADDFYYAINHNTDSLFRVDAVSGAITDIGPHNAPVDLWGLVVTNSGELFANSWQNNNLYSIDPETGLATEIGHAGGQVGGGLGYDEATDTIYGVINGGAGTRLATVDRSTGAALAIGPGVANLTGTAGIEFDPITGLVIVFDNAGREIFGFDPRSGTGGVLSVTTPSVGTAGLTSNGTDLQFANSGRIYNLDVLTGTYTQSLLMSASSYMDGLEYVAAKDGSHRVRLLADEALINLDFGNRKDVGSIHGTKFDDANGDGIQNSGETAIAGAVLYLDANNNGTLDTGESSTTTDSTGDYTFVDIPTGDYVVRDVVPGGYVQTLPGYSNSYFYGITYQTQDLVRIDAVSGIVTVIGPVNASQNLNGLVVTNSGQLIAASWQTDFLYSIDPTTGAATQIVHASAGLSGGLAYDPATDTIFSIASGGAGARLAIVDRTTGAVTPIGPGIADLTTTTGMEFDPVTGLVVVFDNTGDEYFGFDPRTGEASVLSVASFALTTAGLTFDGTDLVLARGNQIYNVNVNTGVLTSKLHMSSSAFLEALAHVAGDDGGRHVTVGIGDVLTDQDFAIRAAVGSIHGTKFDDANGDGIQNSGETAIAGAVLYLDANNNGTLDTGESSTTTDSTGDYTFVDIPTGDYVVRDVVPGGYVQTLPGYSNSYFYGITYQTQDLVRIDAVSGIVTVIGPVNASQNLNGLVVTNSGQLIAASWQTDFLYSIDPTTGAATQIVHASAGLSSGLAYDPATDTIFSIASGSAGARLAIVDRTTGAVTPIGPGIADLTATTGMEFDPVTGLVVVFDNAGDEYFGFDPRTGEASVLSVASFALTTGGLTFDGTDLVLALGNQIYSVNVNTGVLTSKLHMSPSAFFEALTHVAGDDGGRHVTVGIGDVLTDQDFAIRAAVGSIHGTKFDDANADGVRDAGEGPLAGVTIYLDSNDNGILDSGELSTTTDANGDYVFANVPVGSHTVREVDQIGHTNTSPGYSDSFFYALDQNTEELVAVDAGTGQVTRIGAHGAGVILDGLTVTKTGQLYATTPYATGSLYSIDPNTGVATLIGPTGASTGSDLAYDAATDTIYTVTYGSTTRLAMIDAATGIQTTFGPGVSDLTYALGTTFDPVSGNVIVFDYSGSEFFSFSPIDGVGTLLSVASPAIFSNGLTTTEFGPVMSSSITTLIQVDPATGSQSPFLTLSEPVLTYALEYVRGADAAHRVTVGVGDVLTQLDFGSHYIPPTPQEIAPVVINAGAANRSGIGTLEFTFDINVTATSASTLRLFNHTTQQLIDVTAATVTGNGTPSLTWDLSAISLPRGRYTAELWPDQIVSDEGVHPDFVKVTEFHVSPGDMNGDARVDFADFGEIGANFDPLLGTAFRAGDGNGDGRVDFADFGVVGGNFAPLLLDVLEYDYGDAPENQTQFATTLINDGARHVMGSGLILGSVVDAETDGQPSAIADGDGADDDGISFGSLQQGLIGSIVVDANVPSLAFLNVWIDFNQNGVWDNEAGEHILNDVPVSDGQQTLTVSIPGNAMLGPAMVRARLTAVPGTAPIGLASSGEVEDYIVQIEVPDGGAGNGASNSRSSNTGAANLLLQGGLPQAPRINIFGMRDETKITDKWQEWLVLDSRASTPEPITNVPAKEWQEVVSSEKLSAEELNSKQSAESTMESLTQLFLDVEHLGDMLNLS